MIKCERKTKITLFILSLLLGIFVGYKTYELPISKSLVIFRLSTISLSILLIIFAYIGNFVNSKYNINNEILLDDDIEDYCNSMFIKYKSNVIIGVVIAILLLLVTFIAEFHAPVMFIVSSCFYFIIFFIYVFPIIDEIITIIYSIIGYKSNCKGEY